MSLYRVLGPVALLLLYWLWKKLRAAQHEDLDARIQNLGKN
jgi:hypothetical protein